MSNPYQPGTEAACFAPRASYGAPVLVGQGVSVAKMGVGGARVETVAPGRAVEALPGMPASVGKRPGCVA